MGIFDFLKSKNDCLSDRYAKMVEQTSFNPFNITINPTLQNTQALPNYQAVFKRELRQTLSNKIIISNIGEKQAIKSYVFNMAESYFNNAGYIPQNTLDEIILQIYNAANELGTKSFKSLDDFKYEVYYMLLNN